MDLWDVAYTDGSVIFSRDKDVQHPGATFIVPKKQQHDPKTTACTINPKGHGPTNTINQGKLTAIFVALQQGHISIATNRASTPRMVTMGFDLQPGSLAAQPAQLFRRHKKYPCTTSNQKPAS
eukprot:1151602-Pelagomonas_calceolata.AAC.4